MTVKARGALAQFPDSNLICCGTVLPSIKKPAVKVYLPSAPPASTDVRILLFVEPSSFIIQRPMANAAGATLLTVKISLRTSSEQMCFKTTPSESERDGIGLTVTVRGALAQFPDLKLICCDTAATPLTAPAVKLYLPPVPAATDVLIVLFVEPSSFIIQLTDAPGATLLTVKISLRTSPEQRSVKTTPSESKIVGFGSTVMTRGALVQSPNLKLIF